MVVGFTIGLVASPVFVLVFEGPTARILDEIDITSTLEELVPFGLAAEMALGLTDFLSRGISHKKPDRRYEASAATASWV